MIDSSIIFLPFPESLKEYFTSETQEIFRIDPDIPIPVEIPRGSEKFYLENMSIEMVISGMLRVIEAREVCY